MDKEKIDRLIAAFDEKVPQIEEERKGLYELRKEFVEYFNKEKLASMSLDEYCLGKEKSIRNFSYGLQFSLNDLGTINGRPGASTLFGVWYSKKEETYKLSYTYSKQFGDLYETAFEQVKKDLLALYDAGASKDLDSIYDNPHDDWLKGKFLATYFPEDYLSVFSRTNLDEYIDCLELEPEYNDTITYRDCLLNYKKQHVVMKNWSADIFSVFLWSVIKDEIKKEAETTLKDNEKKNTEYIQCIYFGTPGSGKSYKVDKEILGNVNKDYVFRTTFHPDTDYASFVGIYKPTMNDHHEIEYQFVPQVFSKAYVAAWNNPTEQIYLVIEEINRGNCAQIFGDLFQLLDRNKEGKSEYPIDADVDLCKFLKANLEGKGTEGIENEKLCLPSNLNILATMNTSDQSLFPMDSAFKRRWDWEFVPSHSDDSNNFNIKLGDKTYKWHDFLGQINERIKTATDSEDKQLGTYFIKGDVDAKQFKSKVMFYLWSEICKEEYGTTHNFFRRKTENGEPEFSFNELYDNGAEDAAILIEFMDYLKVPADTSASEE